ncbi:MAG: DUF1615 family protein [Thiofilum sp.]|uniref:DUF1615 family protein n=1 Tax=Thiofilum sp. TaxID=2212733 RepID=UPI0025D21358|nr:DUF1615 family protein [Thiofilum sp.]MBK8451737.1 DUF1615 family protein [Thiofilum sp.]
MLDDLIDGLRKIALWVLSASFIGLGFWAYPTIKDHLNATQQTNIANPKPTIAVNQVTALIKAAEPQRPDPKSWAIDMLDVLKQHGLAQSKENVCSIIAVVDQESGFVANPAVPNLGKLSEKAVINKLNQIPILGGQAEKFLNTFPDPKQSFMARIRSARTERDLDLAYRDLITELSKRYKFDFLIKNSLARNLIEGQNEIDTIGSMQVAVSFAVQYEREQRQGKALSLEEIYQVRDKLYTRKGGLFYGTLLLLGYETGYDRKIYRFADFNAGRYASRNAAFQALISELTAQKLMLDGDLLIYSSSGTITNTLSQTENALRLLNLKYSLNLTDKKIRSDLMLEKSQNFKDTQTYKLVRELYQKQTKHKPVYAIIPTITLNSEKTSRILTTERFAINVNQRYQTCMKR